MSNKTGAARIDPFSFQLGMINCFVEMVACGVKKLAISPPLSPGDYPRIGPLSDRITSGFGIQSHLEKSLLLTDLQSEDFTRGKWSILYYREDGVLQAYLHLKKRRQNLERAGALDVAVRRDLSRDFMRLLSYPENVIEEKLSGRQRDPYMLTDD